MNFHIGQKIVCVDDEWRSPGWINVAHRPVKGGVYTIRAMHINPLGLFAVYLVEITNPEFNWWQGRMEVSFNACRFRPIVERKTDISIFTEMLVPIAPRVLEPTS